MTDHFDAQDNAGPLAIFYDGHHSAGTFIETVPAHDTDGQKTRRTVADRLGVPLAELEVLTTCRNHPATAALDCLACWPLDDPSMTAPARDPFTLRRDPLASMPGRVRWNVVTDGRVLGWVVYGRRSRLWSAYVERPNPISGHLVGRFPTRQTAADEVWIQREIRSTP